MSFITELFSPWFNSLRAGQGNSYTEITRDGTILSYGKATVWDDLTFPANAINPTGAASDADIDASDTVYIGTLLFDASATELCAGVAQFPHKMKIGSIIHPHIHWIGTTTGTGNVLWRLSYDIADVNGTFTGTYTDIDVLAAAPASATKHCLAEFGEIDMSAYTGVSSMMLWRVSRIGGDATDTYAADARLLEFDIHYEIDSMGSREEYVK